MLIGHQVLAKMRTNTVRKIGLVFLFSLGAFTMVAAILRIISIFVVSIFPLSLFQ